MKKKLLTTFKAFKTLNAKKLPAEEIKQRVTAMKQQFDEEEQKKEAIFMQRIKEEELQEKEILLLAHQSQLERSRVAAEEALQVLAQQLHQKEQSLTESNKQNLQGIQNNYWKDVYNTILNQQGNFTKLIERQHNEQIDFLVKMQEEEDSLFTTELVEIEDLCKEQDRSEIEKKDLCAVIFSLQEQVKRQHSEQMRELLVVQKEELIDEKKEQKNQRQEVKKNAPENLLYEYARVLKKEQLRKQEEEEDPSPPSFVPAPPPLTVSSLPPAPQRMSSVTNFKKENTFKPLSVPVKPKSPEIKSRSSAREVNPGTRESNLKRKKKQNCFQKMMKVLSLLHGYLLHPLKTLNLH